MRAFEDKNMSWTDERIDRLRALWTQGMTASHIAEELGGVSRNAVIGKAHRLGLQSRPSPVKATDPAPKPKPAKAKEKPQPSADAEAAPAAPAPAPRPKAEPRPVAEAPPFATGDESDDAPAPAPVKAAPQPMVRSIGPGGFVRQGPSDQQAPIPPAPPRRLVPAKPSPEIADKTGLLDLNERTCKWPIGHPGEPDFHFCGNPANPGFPYCVQHCGVAYQAQLPRRDRKPPPPLPFGGPRVR
jgi:GcrA cell cycle regulator